MAESPQLFERFVYGLALVDRDAGLLYMNRKARELLVPIDRPQNEAGWTCCDLICGRLAPVLDGNCLTEKAISTKPPLPEIRMDIDGRRSAGAAWVTVARVDAKGRQLLFHLRPGRRDDRRRRSHPEWAESSPGSAFELYVSTLGKLRVEGSAGSLDGEWLEQRPGQLLKYLVCERHRMVTVDMIAEALWPQAGPDEAANRARHYVHALREKLEPDRARRSPSRFVVARRGGYHLDTNRVKFDSDEFEREACAGLTAFVQGLGEPAANHIENALRLYRAPFLAEDPYEEWALEERERLHELTGRALRAQVRIQTELLNLDAAVEHARRLAEMEPFDMDAQRLILDLCIRRGRRSEAFRRYSALRKRMLRFFGQEPDFDLSELEGQYSASAD
ncbi:MAG TPA: BTAD domain-containing putative transcriptional regulator [Solirubrobacterales bacterium]|nr:BTAD domain-containing putative transcriptional regulator [Solirubrobacterales bacterium]